MFVCNGNFKYFFMTKKGNWKNFQKISKICTPMPEYISMKIPCFIIAQQNFQDIRTYPAPSLIIQGSSHINSACHIFYCKSSAKISSGDFVTDSRSWKKVFIWSSYHNFSVSDIIYVNLNKSPFQTISR